MSTDIWGFNSDIAQRNLYIRWDISLWCNYNCSYCFYENHSREQIVKTVKSNKLSDILRMKRTKKFSGHSFDNYSAKEWVQKIKEIANGRKISIGITGGEPFLDKENFSYVLNELIKMDEIDNIRIDTNGTFVPKVFEGMDYRKVFLNISFHPESTTIDKLIEKVKKIQEVGMNVLMINYVMTPNHREKYEEIFNKFAEIGVSVNPGVYYDVHNPESYHNESQIYTKYLKEFDILNKCGQIDLQGKVACNFPKIGLVMSYCGDVFNPCYPNKVINLFDSNVDEVNALLKKDAPKCPMKDCGCLQQYSFQAECTRNQKSLNVLKNYVEDAILLAKN